MIANSPCNNCLSSQVCMYKGDAQAIWDKLQDTSYNSTTYKAKHSLSEAAFMPLKTEKNFSIVIKCNHAIYRETLYGGED